MNKSFGRVAVLMGGESAEREISLLGGAAVLKSLQRSGIDAVGIDAEINFLEVLKQKNISHVFIMLHGKNGEDGKVQQQMEIAGIPYTGSGVTSSALAMDKILCKELWQKNALSTPDFVVLDEKSDWDAVLARLGTSFVKPVKEGSSIGIGMVRTSAELQQAYQIAKEYDSVVMAEKWIDGPEYTVAILGDKILPVIELKTVNEFYDYEAKYEVDTTQYLCPCDLSEADNIEISSLSKQAYDMVGCTGWGRVDVMRDGAGKFWLLEVNTIPGMTDHSLVPMAAKEAGIDFDSLVLEILASSKNKRIGAAENG
ncbi:D-alanine--D-alanine ligase [Gammaproteobacteria bacterium]|nr:D-alanine--D-alanine ligase [Gammaproteobacteria bacterium]